MLPKHLIPFKCICNEMYLYSQILSLDLRGDALFHPESVTQRLNSHKV